MDLLGFTNAPCPKAAVASCGIWIVVLYARNACENKQKANCVIICMKNCL